MGEELRPGPGPGVPSAKREGRPGPDRGATPSPFCITRAIFVLFPKTRDSSGMVELLRDDRQSCVPGVQEAHPLAKKRCVPSRRETTPLAYQHRLRDPI